jgi:hypothetical protein
MVMLVSAGQVDVKKNGKEYAMKAPPGDAYLHWDSVPPFDEKPRRLEELPAWAKGVVVSETPANLLKDAAALVKVVLTRAKEGPGSLEGALVATLGEDNQSMRRISVYGLGALDDLPHLLGALANAKYPDVRDVSVIALRHWIGRKSGQDAKLYEALMKNGYSDKHAAIVMQLLHSFGDQEKASPATYETLIDLLTHEKPAIRELAGWHLVRLVPAAAAKNLSYDSLAPAAELEKTQAKWRELVPAGKLPPKGERAKDK